MIKNTNYWKPATEWIDEFTRVKSVEINGEIVNEYYNYSWLHRIYWDMGDRPPMGAWFYISETFEDDVKEIFKNEVRRESLIVRNFGLMNVVFAEFLGSVSILAGNESDLILLEFFAGTKCLDVIYNDFMSHRYDYSINKLSAIARLRSTEIVH